MSGTYQNRSMARLAAIQALYQFEQSGDSIEKIVNQFVNSEFQNILGELSARVERHPHVDQNLFLQLARETAARIEELDTLIQSHLTANWTLQRLESVSRAILRVAMVDFIIFPETPMQVLIKEYVDLSAAFVSDPELSFISGILNRIARVLRPTTDDTE